VATGRGTKLVGQAGEFLVAAQLARLGLIATTFTGNVPHYDIIASNERGKHVAVQVKTIKSGSWQFGDISRFCEVVFRGRSQVVGRKRRSPVPGLVCVLVQLGEYGKDRFYVLKWEQLRDELVASHKQYLERWGGRRPYNPKSLHVALLPSRIARFANNWPAIQGGLR
jgi:hypothetical protein